MAQPPPRPHVVVFIDFAGDFGGAETLAVQLLERLDPQRFRRTLVAYQRLESHDRQVHAHASTVARLRDAEIDVLELNRRDRRDLAAWRPFLRMLRAGDVDVLHSHKLGPNVWATSFARFFPVRVVLAHEHSWSFEGSRQRMLADRWLVGTGCDAFIAVSERDRQRMETVEGIPAARLRYIPNGIPALAPARDDDRVRRELAIPDGAPVVGAVGVFRLVKDFESLVRAHAALLERMPDAHLVIVGDGPEKAAVQRLVADLGIAERVRLPGLRDDAVRLAGAFDVAVNSSRSEGSSLAVLEYMALGRPIVATAVGGTPDLLGQGEAGVLVPSADPEALGTAIGDLLADPAYALELGERARRRQREHYDVDVQAQRIAGLYEELLATANGRRRRLVRR
jgi:glycosyltransferase involved in cell wall biosynthesis